MKYCVDMSLPPFDIVDFHLHFPVESDDWLKPYREKYISAYGQEKWYYLQNCQANEKSWLNSFGFGTPDKPFENPKLASLKWLEQIKEYNLKKVVFLTGGGNEILSQEVNQNREVFAGFAHHHIEEENAAEKLEKAIKYQGLVGYKILAPTVSRPLDCKVFEEVFEVCDVHRLPVNIHFGILGGLGGVCGGVNISPDIIGEVVKRFPRANFIVPHFGCGFTDSLLRLCWGASNVYVDTSGNNLWTKWTMGDFTLEQLFAKFYATVGAERIIFGTDSEWFPRGFAVKYLIDQYQATCRIGMPQQHQQMIFAQNALRLLKEVKI